MSRTVHPGPTPHVTYELTALGRGFLEPMNVMCAWAAEHFDELLDARESHPAATGHGRP
ncbi:winged helix-turn-helix transcriptional regulator [Streptomyces litchfieldiae]|uniref:Winged helix-turn-helix transcriptional regulator n=1 Tax=Streptomyces litchfieldiae TaxID=3075543 RepID=A0ABU2MVV5_9ACTN|nr:winged helix-turn-helix transcriptional regulator [Streptomyces sp. DSM 44938]MDT0344694.1 winged helix-turn-helix transcriptional regulator [Streptomyces sp. DSM 44938]